MLTTIEIEALRPRGKREYRVSDGGSLFIVVYPTGGKVVGVSL